MVISADDSVVYAALAGGFISKIDTATLKETARWSTGALSCPIWLALTGTKLWVSYGCSSGEVAAMDTSSPNPTLGTGLAALVPYPSGALPFYYPPKLASDGVHRLVLMVPDLSSNSAFDFDVSTTPPTLTGQAVVGGGCNDVAVTSSGLEAVFACNGPSAHSVYRLSDFTLSDSLPTGQFPNSVATGGDLIAAGLNRFSSALDLQVFDSNHVHVNSWDFKGVDFLDVHALALSRDGKYLFAVSHPWTSYQPQNLHIITDPGLYPTTITLTAPAAAARGSQLAVSGTLSSPFRLPPAGTPLTISRSDAGGIHLLPDAPMAADGSFSFNDAPDIGGAVTYGVGYAGDATRLASSAQAIVQVSLLPTVLTLSVSPAAVAYGRAVTLRVHLAPTFNSRTVSVSVTPAGQAEKVLTSTAVNSTGDLTLAYAMTRNAVFTARFAGDYQYAAVSVTGKATSATRVTQRQTGYHATSGSYRLYRTNVHPGLIATIAPAHRGSCVYFSAQRFYSGAWHTIATSGCFALNSSSAATAYLSVKPVRGSPYRFRATFKGDAVSTAASGGWQYFKFD